MRRSILLLTLTAFCASLLLFSGSSAAGYWEKAKDKKQTAATAAAPGKKDTEKPFGEVIKGFDKIPGLFDFYMNKKDLQVYMAIKPSQFGKEYLCNVTRTAGDGTFAEGALQGDYFLFTLKQVGKRVQFIQTNVNFRADSSAELSKSLERSISKAIFGSTIVASMPDTSGAILIDPASILVSDVDNINYFVGSEGKTGFRFDRENSNFGTIKSFPQNSEIDVVLHYKSDKPNSGMTLASPYSLFMTYHYSFSTLPEGNYRPRLADDRIGMFQTIYQDYTNLDTETPYVRYVNRWKLEKKDSTAVLSEPKEPIVYWLENTTPEEYRDDIRDGVLSWNKAFEAAGFKNAIVVKQMPDTADWDPADVRFNVIRWIVWPTQTYGAIGQSRKNPYTGQVYDADIMVVANTIRNIFAYADNFLEPVKKSNGSGRSPFEVRIEDLPTGNHNWETICDYGEETSQAAAAGLAILQTRSSFEDKSELTKKYVKQYLHDLAAHEVGHTLGLRHNFKASTVYTLAQLSDSAFVAQNGVVNTVMEYTPPNIAADGKPQPNFFNTETGPWDSWVIEYGYKPIDAKDPQGEKVELDKIASHAADPLLAYGTDEDCFGNSSRAIDPYVTQGDLSADPILFWQRRIDLSKELWSKIEKENEKPGQNYRKLRTLFAYGWGSFGLAGNNVARFIGGIQNFRDHIGDPNGRLPFLPVPAAKQREAMKFIVDNIWSPDAFKFSPGLLNKLQTEKMSDFIGTAWSVQRIDYPLHDRVLSIQRTPFDHIYNPITLGRLNDIGLHYDKGQDVYTMSDVFQDVRRAIWSEVTAGRNIDGMRRNLQRAHLDILVDLVTNTTLPVPEDAVTLARVDLRTLKGAIGNALAAGTLDTITRGHLEDSLARINAALEAKINLKI